MEIAPNSLKHLLNLSKTISNSVHDFLCWFLVNSQGPKIGRFWAKSLGYSPWFLNRADFGKSWKSLQTLWEAWETLLKRFITPCSTCFVEVGWIGEGRKLAVFEQKAWAITHGFEHGGFWYVLEIAPKSLRRLVNPSKTFSNSLHDCLCWFRVNSQGSKISRY